MLSKKKNYPKRIELSKFAYTNYQKELNALKGYLRGKPFDKETLLIDLNKLDDLVADQCPTIRDSIRAAYNRKFTDCSMDETTLDGHSGPLYENLPLPYPDLPPPEPPEPPEPLDTPPEPLDTPPLPKRMSREDRK